MVMMMMMVVMPQHWHVHSPIKMDTVPVRNTGIMHVLHLRVVVGTGLCQYCYVSRSGRQDATGKGSWQAVRSVVCEAQYRLWQGLPTHWANWWTSFRKMWTPCSASWARGNVQTRTSEHSCAQSTGAWHLCADCILMLLSITLKRQVNQSLVSVCCGNMIWEVCMASCVFCCSHTQQLTEPMKLHLKQLEQSIEEQLNQLSILKAIVLQNDQHIHRLLTGEDSK